MSTLGSLHPQIVHFVVALGLVGILLRILAFLVRAEWVRYTATILLLIAAGASVLAVKSGDEAHGPAERIPGARDLVHEHEEAGERTRNLLLVVALLEIAALAIRKRNLKAERGLLAASALVGVVTAWSIYNAGKLGGDLVYSYAGGVGMRPGDPDDVKRLLIAGLFHKARVAREAGNKEEAARLTDELARQVPDDVSVQILSASSLLKDRNDPVAARAAIETISVPADNARLVTQKGALMVEVLRANGQPDSADVLLKELLAKYPDNRMLKQLAGDR